MPRDRELLRRCLGHEQGAWNDFVDRYLGLIYHVVQYTAYLRSMPLRPEDIEDLSAEVLTALVANDYAALRQFRGNCSLSSYLTVIARRVAVQELVKRSARDVTAGRQDDGKSAEPATPPTEGNLETLEEVSRLLRKLPDKERDVVRLYYLEARSYEEISKQLDIPMNSVGPILTRAREKLRKDVKSPPAKYNPDAPMKAE